MVANAAADSSEAAKSSGVAGCAGAVREGGAPIGAANGYHWRVTPFTHAGPGVLKGEPNWWISRWMIRRFLLRDV